MTTDTLQAAAPSLTREQFLHAFGELADRFERNREVAGRSEQAFRAAVDGLVRQAERDPMAGSMLAPDNPLRERIADQAAAMRSILVRWAQDLARREAQAEFRDKTGDSLLVFVYGKVKAGKSSLGNYVARGHHDPARAGRSGAKDTPVFFVHDSTGLTERTGDAQIRARAQFGVDMIEATSAIQGFRLPGLTWVDSPGLHSKTGENEALARKYVDAADIVLYLTSSTAPGKRSDIEVLKELGRREHTLAVLVTGSDTVDEDVDDRGEIVQRRVMKSDGDRAEQLAYVRGVLDAPREAGASKLEDAMVRTLRQARIFSISVKYAEENPDATGMARSGVGPMLHQVAALAQGKGVRNKLQRPLRNLRAFLEDVRERDLQGLQDAVDAAAAELARVRKDARRRALAGRERLHHDIGQKVDDLARKHAMDDDGFQRAVNDALRHAAEDGARLAAQAFAAAIDEGLPSANEAFGAAAPRFERKTIGVRRKKTVGALSGGAIGTAAVALGAMVLTSGTAALVIGVLSPFIGGIAGGKVGGLFDGEEVMSVDVGNNSDEVAAATRKNAQGLLAQHMERTIARMDEICFVPAVQWTEQLADRLADVREQTTRLARDLEQQLPAAPACGLQPGT